MTRASISARALGLAAALAALVAAPPASVPAATHATPASPFAEALHWRSIGPYRGGRAVAVAGVAGDPRTFYFGAVGGGVWKTTNAGTTWTPVMDAQSVASIGALAVAPSDPNTVYAGSGEADMRSDIVHGNGLYRSTDAGATWTHAGLTDSRQIGRILVDPSDARTLLVAALGHAYGPSDMRGVYRSTDGGATWSRTLFRDRDTGAIDLAADPAMHVVFASLWQTRRPPWSVYAPSNGPGSGLYKSLDGGRSWQRLSGHGLPERGLGKIGLAVAPSDPNRVYAIVDASAGGLYRSDDAGANWRLVDGDPRLWGRGWYFEHVAVDPKDADTVYVSNTSFYRSTSGGARFTAIKGSPDGDDFHFLWIDPAEPSRMILGSDQGASVSLDGARTWSSWFNQPTGQFYHVATDGAFPYRLYGAQQDSGAAEILSRSAHRRIEERDWRPITAGGESGTIAPAPGDPDVAYGGTVVRERLSSAQVRALSPTAGRPGEWREEWTQPLAFGADGALYVAHQQVFRTRSGGDSWTAVSGDLARRRTSVPPTLDPATAADAGSPEPRGVVYALGPSPRSAGVIWAGTDDGLVYLTRDGARSWRNVTPRGLSPWSHVDAVEASHFDPRTAYVAVDRHRLDDDRPYAYITHDAGRTWRSATAGIPYGSVVNVLREDPVRPGLLYAGTETGVFVSFDDGRAWQSLRLDMPVVSVRDISVRDGDLAIATHGRAFWILDDVEPLREAPLRTRGLRLFRPRVAIRTRPYDDEAEASPPEVSGGENPPNGAYVDYALPASAAAPVVLAIVDAAGRTVRRWSSDDPPATTDPSSVDYPAFWLVTPPVPAATPGMHRFVWDFRLDARDGPFAPPGRYRVRLTTGGRTLTEPLVLRRDPRAEASDADLVAQAALARSIYGLRGRTAAALHAPAARGAVRTRLLSDLALLTELEASVESADARPTAQERAAWRDLRPAVLRELRAHGAS